jgi:hypothetical protein
MVKRLLVKNISPKQLALVILFSDSPKVRSFKAAAPAIFWPWLDSVPAHATKR